MQLRGCALLATSVLLSSLITACAVSTIRRHGRTLKGAVHDASTQTDPFHTDTDDGTFIDDDDDDFINPLSVAGKADARYKNLMIVSTLDGKLNALDADQGGQLLWSINVGAKPLLSSSISNLEVVRNGRNSRLIPSLDGSLYQFNGEDMERLPFNADTLLSSSSRLTEDTMVVGSRDTSLFGISPYTGQVKYICGSEGCGQNEGAASDEDILTVRRKSHTVRAIHIGSGGEKWNFSVGQHEIDFIDSYNHQDDESFFSSKHVSLKVYVPDGTVIANSNGDLEQELWRYQFNSPITKAWKLQDGFLEEISTFDCRYVPGLHDGLHVLGSQPMLFFGLHKGQLYVQPSMPGADEQHVSLDDYLRSFLKKGGNELVRRLPRIRWKPYLSTAPSRTPHISNMAKLLDYDKKAASREQHVDDYPYDVGYYLIPDVTYVPNYIPELEDFSDHSNDNDTDGYFIYINESIWVWWKEIIAISLCTSIFVQVLLNHVVFRKRESPEQEGSQKERTFSESSRSDETDYQRPGVGFVSRFHTDFDVIETLGRGGFGVVFKAKNKMDELEYAVKRICVKNTPKARDKVLREARAMAKLEHVGIIRYHQVFVETPPVGWQRVKDLELFGPEMTSTLSTPGTDTPVTPSFPAPQEPVPNKFRNPLQICDEYSESLVKADFTRSDSLEVVFEHSSSVAEVPFSRYTDSNIEDSHIDDSKVETSNYSEVSVHRGDGDFHLETESESSKDETSKSVQMPASASGSFSIANNNENEPSVEEKPPKLYLYIQMQLCQRATLKDWLSANTLKRDCNLLLDYFTQIVNAVAYVHHCQLIHRDLKPSNIYFSVNDHNIIKVGDFGLVTAHEEEPALYDDVTFDAQGHTNQVGTQLYMSPEQMKGLPYGQKVDIFSLGLIFLEFFYPSSTQMEKITVLSNAKNQNLPSRFVRELPQESEFVRWLTHQDPTQRPTAVEMLESDMLRDVVPSSAVLPRRSNSTGVMSKANSSIYSVRKSSSAITLGKKKN